MDTPEQVKIWKRIRGDAQPITDGLPGLTAGALAEATLYGNLARQIQGPGQKILLSLQEDALSAARCLKGIYQIATGMAMNVAAVPPANENTDVALRKSYGRALKTLTAYESRSHHGEYGAVFSCLAAKKREHCCKIAELMGLLGV
ncbi:MAG: hypothetical protein E7462_00295 [Ruminococcaceae bacterium]|nr:hypothetical protein [Oscillospiraceae bacterium]